MCFYKNDVGKRGVDATRNWPKVEKVKIFTSYDQLSALIISIQCCINHTTNWILFLRLRTLKEALNFLGSVAGW